MKHIQCLKRAVPESLDQKYDSKPTTGHQFFCLKHVFLYLNILALFLLLSKYRTTY
jgi:hypothetical protein